MTEARHFPKQPSPVGTVLLTSYDHFAHENIIAHAQADQALLHGGQIAASVDDARHHLHTLTLLLCDAPEEPLLSASAAQKGSVLGLVALGYLITHSGFADKAREIVIKGQGVMLLNITGDAEALMAHPQLFETWDDYAVYLRPLLASGDFTHERPSSFS
ncbi:MULTISPECIES: hypothetical protein [Pseudomonas]|jgi:hypothetical protein|uniref:Uncharacterized protein n=1 Tax=Pseudomonas mosselii TaxID=78327 RepID=A0A5R8YSY3_9PSED|nr:hypothetical protein [Pseudomonas mosselii]TLP56077.1 hypothetical protein FEM01_19020 [Pseudomonas mosselii]